MKWLKKENAITLIALVITIIVLLILAGVAISYISGDDGILKRTETAREETIIAKEKEQIAIAYLNCSIDGSVTASRLQTELRDMENDVDAIPDETSQSLYVMQVHMQ